MKKWLLLLLLIPAIALAGFGVDCISNPTVVDEVTGPTSVDGVVADDYTDIIWWWRCEGTTLGADDYYGVGDNTANAMNQVSISATAMKVGTNGLYTNGTGNMDRYQFDVDGDHVSGSEGNIAFWHNNKNWVDGKGMFYVHNSSGHYILIEMRGGSDSDIEPMFRWDDGTNSWNFETTTHNGAENTWYFYEFCYKVSTGYVEIFKTPSGGSRSSIGSSSETMANITFGLGTLMEIPYSDTSVVQYHDNIMISDSSTRNFSLLRNLTASPR